MKPTGSSGEYVADNMTAGTNRGEFKVPAVPTAIGMSGRQQMLKKFKGSMVSKTTFLFAACCFLFVCSFVLFFFCCGFLIRTHTFPLDPLNN